jgi:hypothetical protein
LTHLNACTPIAPQPSLFTRRFSRCCAPSVDSVATESIFTPASPSNDNSKPELGLLIVVKEEFDPSTCAYQISDEVKCFQLRQVMSEIGVVSASAKEATASTPEKPKHCSPKFPA